MSAFRDLENSIASVAAQNLEIKAFCLDLLQLVQGIEDDVRVLRQRSDESEVRLAELQHVQDIAIRLLPRMESAIDDVLDTQMPAKDFAGNAVD